MKYDVIIIGAGLAGIEAGMILQEAGLSTAAIAVGRSLNEPDYNAYTRLGGELFMGDRVLSGVFDGDNLSFIRTEKLAPAVLTAKSFILSTGKFTSGGLTASREKVRESIFSLETFYEKDPSKWFDSNFFAAQPFLSFGIRVDDMSRPYLYNTPVHNLFAAGEIIAGSSITLSRDTILESAHKAARIILEQNNED